MGSAHSTRAQPPSEDGDEPQQNSQSDSRSGRFRRRLSTLMNRRESRQSSQSKRERSNSVQPVRPVPKRRRLDDGDADGQDVDANDHDYYDRGDHGDNAETSYNGSGGPSDAHGAVPSNMELSYPHADPARAQQRLPYPLTARYAPPPPASDVAEAGSDFGPNSPGSSSPMRDELLSDRLRTISTIRDALGPDWRPSPSATGPSVERLLNTFRRHRRNDADGAGTSLGGLADPGPSSSTPALTPAGTSTPSTTASSTHSRHRGIGHRLSAFMGFSAPGSGTGRRSAAAAAAAGVDNATDSTAAPTSAAAGVAAAAAAMARAATPATPATASGASTSDHNNDPANAETPSRIAVGPVLVIQGLAQTHANGEDGRDEAMDSPSLGQQALMIGNLLTVAAVATATTLLSPENLTAAPSRSTAQSAMQMVFERLLPQRIRTRQTVESALGDYLRTVLRDNRRFNEATSEGSPQMASVPSEFQDFLHTLQDDFSRAVHAYSDPATFEMLEEYQAMLDAESAEVVAAAEGLENPRPGAAIRAARERATGGATGGATEAATERATEAATETATEAATETAAEAATETAAETAAETATEGEPVATGSAEAAAATAAQAIPTFHHQRGQNQPSSAAQALGVIGGTDGLPRRLNFFRAHLFPELRPDGSAPNGDNDPEALVPCVFVGVRSLSHPGLTTEELVGHPSFPFVDGNVPEAGAGESEGSTGSVHSGDGAAAAAAAPSPEVSPTSPRRTIRERVMQVFHNRSEPRNPPHLNTYLIYVIGGNYPRNHPALQIPSLVAGGPFTTEDLNLLGELLGPAKPPTATSEELEKSDLRIVKAQALPILEAAGAVLAGSIERCIVCLSEFEDDEDVRILNCRHAFHKDCVDQWLTTGRNSCPSCRTEAVDKNAASTATAAAATEVATAAEEAGEAASPAATNEAGTSSRMASLD